MAFLVRVLRLIVNLVLFFVCLNWLLLCYLVFVV